MVAGLDQADAAEPAFLGARHHRLHQRAAGAVVLDRRVDRDRPDRADRVALVQEIATDDASDVLGYHDVEHPLMADHEADRAG